MNQTPTPVAALEPPPTHEQIRAALLRRAHEYARLTDTPKTTVSKSMVNDPAFLSRIEGGSNFTVALYAKAMAWLDENWPSNTEHRGAA